MSRPDVCEDCGQVHPSTLPPLYDVDAARRELAQARRKRDDLTVMTRQIADDLATHMSRHFAGEELETAGRALIIAAASVAVLDEVPLPLVCNLLGFAGDRLVTDGRDEVPA